MSIYSISNIAGAMGQVSLPFTDLQSSKAMVCPYEKVTDRPDKYNKTSIAIERYHRLSKYVFNEVL